MHDTVVQRALCVKLPSLENLSLAHHVVGEPGDRRVADVVGEIRGGADLVGRPEDPAGGAGAGG